MGWSSEAAYTQAIPDWLSSGHGLACHRWLLTDRADAPSFHDGIRPRA